MESKPGKYLKYAIGEIVLVVIGILIALSINNWNQNRIANNEEKKLYVKIIRDLDLAIDNVKSDLDRLNQHQSMHFHLYKEIRGKATYDPDINYHLLRLTRYYIPIITENYMGSVSDISNERVRDALNDYIKEEKATLKSFDNFNQVKLKMLRPFSEKHGLMNTDVIFNEVQSNWKNVLDTVINVVSYDKLKAQYGSQELDQILSSLWLQSGHVIHRLEVQTEQINKFKAILEDELYKDKADKK